MSKGDDVTQPGASAASTRGGAETGRTVRKLASIDLDGTLLFDRKVASGAAEALQTWRAAGNLAVCNTGKSIEATKLALWPEGGFEGRGADEAVEFDYYVLYTGAVITDAHLKPLAVSGLELDLVVRVLLALYGRENIAVFATTLDTTDLQLCNGVRGSEGSDLMLGFHEVEGLEEALVVDASAPSSTHSADAADAVRKVLHQYTFIGVPIWVNLPEEEIVQVQAEVERLVGEQAEVHRNQNFLDIVPTGADKGTGLKTLLAMLQETSGETYEVHSLGDSWNDLDMHRAADVAVTFPHAPSDVQDVVDVVTASAVDYLKENA